MHGEGRRRYLHRWLPLGALRAAGCTLRAAGCTLRAAGCTLPGRDDLLQIQRLARDDLDGVRSKLRHYFTNLLQLQARFDIEGPHGQSQPLPICLVFSDAL